MPRIKTLEFIKRRYAQAKSAVTRAAGKRASTAGSKAAQRAAASQRNETTRAVFPEKG